MLLSAALFCLAALAALGLHAAMAAGAPWGHMTMGGQVTGRLPVKMRLLSVLQGLLLIYLCLIVTERAGLRDAALVPNRTWLIWVPVGISALALLANSVTQSKPERAFGVPVTLAMLLGSLGVALFGPQDA